MKQNRVFLAIRAANLRGFWRLVLFVTLAVASTDRAFAWSGAYRENYVKIGADGTFVLKTREVSFPYHVITHSTERESSNTLYAASSDCRTVITINRKTPMLANSVGFGGVLGLTVAAMLNPKFSITANTVFVTADANAIIKERDLGCRLALSGNLVFVKDSDSAPTPISNEYLLPENSEGRAKAPGKLPANRFRATTPAAAAVRGGR